MKLFYQLPYLTYDYTNSRFIDFEFEEALQLYKLIYKDLNCFQKHFLQKLEWISNLESLCIELGNNFEKATPMNLKKLRKVKDESVRSLADYFSDISISNENKTDKSFFNNFIDKLKEFLNSDNYEIYWHKPPASFSDLVIHKTPLTIRKIDIYEISIKDEYVEVAIRDIRHLKLNENTKYLVCNDCNIESMEFNSSLELLEAYGNQIEEINLSKNLIEVNLWDNPLKYLKLNRNLKKLWLSHPKNYDIEIDNTVNNNEVEIYFSIN
jgi:hypothetical protein